MPTDDLVLDRFLNIDWTDTTTSLLSGCTNDFPFLPLDLHFDKELVQSFLALIKTRCDEHAYYQAAHKPAVNMSKFTIFGYSDYKKYWDVTRKAKNFLDLENMMSDDPTWLIAEPSLARIFDIIPAKKIYMIESRSSFPGGKSYLHWDREVMLSGMYNRLYVPLQWPTGSRLSFHGFGNIDSEPGQVTVINGNQYLHGSHNSGNLDRHALMITADLDTAEYRNLLQISREKYQQKHHEKNN